MHLIRKHDASIIFADNVEDVFGTKNYFILMLSEFLHHLVKHLWTLAQRFQ